MKTVRFAQVVQKAGRPEVYLLLTKDDPDFKKALQVQRVMSLLGESHGAKTGYGVVGYEEKKRPQVLVFPRSLKAFEGCRVVGIKYDLFSEAEKTSGEKRNEPKAREAPPKRPVKAAKKPALRKRKAYAHQGTAPAKVIPFPQREKADKEEDSVSALKAYARQAMRALKKNNSVAAYNLLKRIIQS